MARAVILLIVFCLLCSVSFSWIANDTHCPAQTVQLSLDVGTLCGVNFDTDQKPLYNSVEGCIGLDCWYTLARCFINSVQPENLPYDLIEDTINDNNLQCSVNIRRNCTGGEFDYQATLLDFADRWAPLIAVTVLGGLMGFAFLIVGCFYWCYWCYKPCMGSRCKTKYRNTCTFIIFTTVLLAALLLLAGVILALYNNQRTYDSINSFKGSLKTITDTAVRYMNSTLDEIDMLFCHFFHVSDLSFKEAYKLNDTLNKIIESIATDVDSILGQLSSINNGVSETSGILSDMVKKSQQLQSLGTALDTTLSRVSGIITQLRGSHHTLLRTVSNVLDPMRIASGANYSKLPNVSQELNNVRVSSKDIDIARSIREGRAEFDRITGDIQREVNQHLGEGEGGNSSGVLRELADANDTIFDKRDRIFREVRKVIQDNQSIDDCPSLRDILSGDAGDTTINAGFIRQCYINQVFEQIQQYDVYRYAFSIIICSLSLLMLVLVFLGIILGLLGWRRNCSPDGQTSMSHYGGIFLLVAVGFAFVFAFVILILSSLGFFFGASMQKICQAIEPSKYEVFEKIVDNTELWGGSLLGSFIFGRDSGATFSMSVALRSCEANQALYSALNLSNFFDIRRELLSKTDVFNDLRTQLNETIASFDYQTDSFLGNRTQEALANYTDSGVDAINITAFQEQLEAPILNFDLISTISTLQKVQSALSNAAANRTQNAINGLVDVRDNLLPAIQAQVEGLTNSVVNLTANIQNVVRNTARLVEDINRLTSSITGEDFRQQISDLAFSALNTLQCFIEGFLNDTIHSIEGEVGSCRPLFNVYSEAYNAACQQTVGGLNGYWWSLGFCALCFVPLIVFAVVLATSFLKTEKEDEYVHYDDSFNCKHVQYIQSNNQSSKSP